VRILSLLLLISVGLLGWPLPAAAQGTADLLTLDTATALALDANRRARVADLDEARAADDAAALRTERLPRFDLTVLEGGVLSPIAFSFRQGAFGTFPATGPIPLTDLTVDSPRTLSTGVLFTAVQPLTQLRTLAVGARLLDLGRAVAVEKSRALRLSVVADVKRAYYGLQQVASGLAAIGEAVSQLDELERVVREYVAREAALPADHLAVRTEQARAEQQRLALRNMEATLKERINLLIGRDLSTPFTVAPEFPALPGDGDVAAAVEQARAARPAIREAGLNVQRASEDVRLTERKRVPDVGIAFSFVRLFNVDVIPQTVAAAGIVVSWEPFDWGRRRLERAGKARALEQARLGLQEAEALVTLDVRVKVRKAQEARSGLQVADLARQTAAERLRVATDKYRVEATLLKDVLEAQTAAARAAQEYQQALGAFWTARADMEEAIGEGGLGQGAPAGGGGQ
jgi:outer membrane protein TolC